MLPICLHVLQLLKNKSDRFKLLEDAVGRIWEGFGHMFGGLLGRCLGHWWGDFEKFLDRVREDC